MYDLAYPFKFVRFRVKRLERSSFRLGFSLRQGSHLKNILLSHINIKTCFFCVQMHSETTH